MKRGMQHPLALFIVVLVCVALSAACQGGTQTEATDSSAAPASSAEADTAQGTACSYLGKGEVEAAVGRPVSGPYVSDNGDLLRTCSFRDPERPALNLVVVAVTTGRQATTIYQGHKSLAVDAQPVDGLGEDAFWEQGENDLEILAGDHVVVLTVAPEAAGNQLAGARSLATSVLATLQ